MRSTSEFKGRCNNNGSHHCWLAGLLIGCLILSGCAGYRLGPTNEIASGSVSIQIIPFVNDTVEPRLTDAVTSQLRKTIQRDGTYKLATAAPGDIQVSGHIINYDRLELSLSPRDSLTVRDYRLSLTARVTALDRRNGSVLFEQPVRGYTLVRVGSDLVSAERQALPLLAGDLARNIVALVAEGTW